MIGADVEVPCLDGRTRRYVDLDYAASTPAMAGVWAAVEEFLPWCSSVHRGSGYKSRLATAAYEGARGAVAEFVGARDGTVVLVRNTTEAINVLAAALPEGSRVLSTAAEHHANMLPWRRHDLTVLPVPDSAWELVERCEHALRVA
ncbi:MAG: aminotransferase class V-fold PLP-dependent enzyme, partial [Solirubrobacteraceae bacterium]